ncbi:Nse4 C-terminal-domain-containing protein [Cyathus striatus]|nr:Nse4 C-terminal-domain-containing protein [Cyathus striatus]
MPDHDMRDLTAEDNFVFDPDQDPEEKRAVRQNYRSLTRKIEEHHGNPTDFTAEELLNQVQQADKLFSKVRGPQEATLDSHLLLMASNMGAQKARAMKSGSGVFDIDDFVSKLITYMGGRKPVEDAAPENSDEEDAADGDATLDWDRIGRKALAKSRRVPVTGFMLGPLSIEQKKRGPIKRAKLEMNKDEMKKPQELREEDIARSENETTKNVATIKKILDQAGTTNLFKFVVNPNDFAQSVENIFYLSFLIRDGMVALDIDEKGEPNIYTCEQPSDKDYADGLKKQQMVLEFDMATWKRAIEVFDIRKSLIPQRPAARTKLGDKWYG